MGVKSNIMGDDFLREMLADDRAYKADKLVERWSKMPEIGEGLVDLPTNKARNTAILLENQARSMAKMTEAQLSSNFQGYSPENVLRVVRFAYPQSVRGDIFTEFAMTSVKDSIKYIRPVYTNSQTGEPIDRASDGKFKTDGANEFMDDNYRKAMYESFESRYATELENATVADGGSGAYTATFKNGAFGANGEQYIDGYSYIYLDGDESKVLAMQYQAHNEIKWMFGVEIDGLKIAAAPTMTSGVLSFTVTGTIGEHKVHAVGRYNSEVDLTGQYLGEIELVMTDYQFQPRPITLGVTWTKMTELTLESAFDLSAEEMLMDAANNEIKKSLDYQAVKFGYATQAVAAAANNAVFDASPADAGGIKDSYFHTAQLVQQSIDAVGDKIREYYGRGGVGVMVAGPQAANYLKLNKGFTATGAKAEVGIFKIGELDGKPVFKAPAAIVPGNEILTVWKNDLNENDVAVAFGIYLPFYSTGALQRKNLYTEAAIARFEDSKALMPKYLGKVTINGIRAV